MTKYKLPQHDEITAVPDGMTVDLPIGIKAWVKCGDSLRIATVIAHDDFGRVFDNGYGNPITMIDWYAIAKTVEGETLTWKI